MKYYPTIYAYFLQVSRYGNPTTNLLNFSSIQFVQSLTLGPLSASCLITVKQHNKNHNINRR
jgi:hypothetical protein